MDITILELTFPNSDFNAPFSGRTTTASTASDDQGQSGDSESSQISSALRPVMVGLVIFGLALLAKYLRETRTAEPSTEESQKTLDRV